MSEDIENLTNDAVASPEVTDETTPETKTDEVAEATEATAVEVAAEASAESSADAAEAPSEVAPSEAAAPEAEASEPEASELAASEPEASEKPAPAAADASGERPEIAALRESMKAGVLADGKVIGWNNGGFHVVIGTIAAFCPRSEMEDGQVNEPKSYLDQTLPFRIIKIQQGGKRVVLSRSAAARDQRIIDRDDALGKIEVGGVLIGTVTSVVDFGAFVDIGGVEGLVHVSQIARRKVEKPSDELTVGQEVEVKILKIENGGKRISLSMKALEHDPWTEVAEQFPIGTIVEGVVERTANFGAIVELTPGLTGLLPASTLSIPPDSSIARAYPVGKKLSVLVMSVEPRRRRISLALEGTSQGGTIADYKAYQQTTQESAGASEGFNALASAFQKLKGSD